MKVRRTKKRRRAKGEKRKKSTRIHIRTKANAITNTSIIITTKKRAVIARFERCSKPALFRHLENNTRAPCFSGSPLWRGKAMGWQCKNTDFQEAGDWSPSAL